MIRTLLHDPSTGVTTRAGAEQIDHWRTSATQWLWLDLQGEPGDNEARMLRESFGLHRHLIRDAQRPRHPPKLERFPGVVFLLLKGLAADTRGTEFRFIQIAVVVGDRFLITRRSGTSSTVEAIWDAAADDAARWAGGLPAILASLLKPISRRHLPTLFAVEERLEELEQEIFSNSGSSALAELTGLRTDLKRLRRYLGYHLNVIEELRRDPELFSAGDLAHDLNDIHDQFERSVSLATLVHEQAADLADALMTRSTDRLNHVMKLLTVITVIFVPLTFLAGIYGMNFENIPELKFRHGYHALLAIMAVLAAAQLVVFRRRGWL